MSAGHLSLLSELHRRYIVEETAATLRHDLRNKFAAIAGARVYLKRRFETAAPAVWQEDARVPKFYDLINSELVAAEATLTTKLPAALAAPIEGTRCDAMAVVMRRIAETPWPEATTVKRPTGTETLTAAGDALELELALSCLIENAIDAGSHAISVQCTARDEGGVAIEIVDDGNGLIDGSHVRALEPFFTTKPGRLGLGLNIAKRVMFRSGGKLDVAARPDGERGVRAALIIPAPGQRA